MGEDFILKQHERRYKRYSEYCLVIQLFTVCLMPLFDKHLYKQITFGVFCIPFVLFFVYRRKASKYRSKSALEVQKQMLNK